jgi:hypothetical protein
LHDGREAEIGGLEGFEMRISFAASLVFVVSWLSVSVGLSRADLIDFETGFSRLDPVSTVATATNAVTISTQGGENAAPFIAQVGTTPKNAFERVVDGVILGDTPAGGNPGSFFVTDGAGNVANYLFDLEFPVTEFSVDVYDYAGDGGAAPTDFAVLTAYSDLGKLNVVDTDAYVVPKPRPLDGLAVNLSVSAASIAMVTLEFSTFDRGVGIDNIQFVTVPEPASLGLAVMALGVFLARGRRSRR